MAASTSARALTTLLTGLALSTGCGVFDQLNDNYADDGSVLSVFVTHHPTPEDGTFPPRVGAPTFMTDTGWEVLLDEAFITTVGATFFPCDGSGNYQADLEMYWGALPEDLKTQDLDTVPAGGVALDSGGWCGVRVHYGPFEPGGSDDYQMPNPDAIGTTVFIRGLASKDGVDVPFEVRVAEPISVLVSMTEIQQGKPLKVTDANNPSVTISKNYDAFFHGVDFNNYTQEELNDLTLGALVEETRVSFGTTVRP